MRVNEPKIGFSAIISVSHAFVQYRFGHHAAETHVGIQDRFLGGLAHNARIIRYARLAAYDVYRVSGKMIRASSQTGQR